MKPAPASGADIIRSRGRPRTAVRARVDSPADGLTGVILAGGRSQRFGSDKLRARVAGRTAISRVVGRVRPLVRRLMISTASDGASPPLPRNVAATVEYVPDRNVGRRAGPAAAIAGALSRIPNGPVLVVPGDMPWIERAALRRLVAEGTASGADVAVPCWPSGETENLVQWHRDAGGIGRLVPGDVRSWAGRRASEFLRALPRTRVVPLSTLTHRPISFAHLTFRSDLRRPRARGSPGPWTRPRTIEGEPKQWYRRAHLSRAAGRGAESERAFLREAAWYDKAVLPLLADHARSDATRATSYRPGRGPPSG